MLFDLDNTLIDRQAAFGRWADWFAEEHQLGASGAAWLRQADDDGFARRDDVFDSVRARFDLRTSTEELITTYRRTYPDFLAPDGAVTAALVALRSAGWLLGIVTNGPPTQHTKITRAGLTALFDGVCVSDEVGVAKPDRAIFELAARGCGASLSGLDEGWMVGDAPVMDVGGGWGAGLKTIWMARGRAWPEADFAPDVVVDSIADAAAHLLGDASTGPEARGATGSIT